MKSYTDIEQSKKLAEILPLKSADMWYWEWPTAPKYNNYERPMFHKGEGIHNVPCWSLAALLSVLPRYELNNFGDIIQLDVNLETLGTEGNETLLDLVVNMIIRLNELKML